MATIDSVLFNENTSEIIKAKKYGQNWPVVYIINSQTEAYIGETVNVSTRAAQHLRNEERRKLEKISFISDDNFNKSVVLDLENYLINHMSADGKFVLQNGNMGMSPHNYYQQEEYKKTFSDIWGQLKNMHIVEHDIDEIHNSDAFKYSPYKTLTVEQYKIVDSIIEILLNGKLHDKRATIVVKGEGGTGKTVLAIYLLKLLAEANNGGIEIDFEMDPGYVHIAENLQKLKGMKVGLVVPMQSLRGTIKKVLKNVRYIDPNMIISPLEVPREQYDLLIVDEAHRLRQRRALSQYPPFDKNNEKLELDNSGTELDWILKCSKNHILFYDDEQSVKPSDIDKRKFRNLQHQPDTYTYCLGSQLRCLGGNDYIKYVKDILSNDPPNSICKFDNYDFKMFDDVDEMVANIQKKDKEYGLCRVVAGYSWKWKSKKTKEAFDINIDGSKYRWNTVNVDWVNSTNSVNEIGCIHTIQGYELNYAGVILGNEIQYDPEKEKIVVSKKNYWDIPGKTALKDDNELKEYIINIYKTMLTRGIKGTYLYVCDENLRYYLRKFIYNFR